MKRKLQKILALSFVVFIVALLATYVFYKHQVVRLFANTKTWTSDKGDVTGTIIFSYIGSFNIIEDVPGVGKVHAREAFVFAKVNNALSNPLLQWVPVRIFLGGETDSGEPIHLFVTPLAYRNTSLRPPFQSPVDVDVQLRTMKTFRSVVFLTRNDDVHDASCRLCLVYNFFLAQNKHTRWIPLLPAAVYLEME